MLCDWPLAFDSKTNQSLRALAIEQIESTEKLFFCPLRNFKDKAVLSTEWQQGFQSNVITIIDNLTDAKCLLKIGPGMRLND